MAPKFFVFTSRALVINDDIDNIDWGLENGVMDYDDTYEK